MKLYLALNENGTSGEIALHTKLAVLSARKYTNLDIKMLYIGRKNGFTEWLEEHNVEVIMQELPYYDLIKKLTEEGLYNLNTVGHWLRTNVCLETKDEFVLYSDIDVLFRMEPMVKYLSPEVFCAAPEFNKDQWNYFNAGVMLINAKKLKEEYHSFEHFLRENIAKYTYGFNDQSAYNIFYRHRWEKLNLNLNWKPYWGINRNAQIIHFHGSKIGAIKSILDNSWNWDNNHGKQIGTLFGKNIESYRYYIGLCMEYSSSLLKNESDLIEETFAKIVRNIDLSDKPVDDSFMEFKMFND
ncbi:glycosyltransferase [Gluconacetobacter tumulicola]|uniref:Glycosyl transferase n=1 Tax=Gluconacetobacter tumulicola TaxID=1017177 RepID=A0A7W4PBJ4_9PROT|nr:glycosyltransferase [Gluconacetobacter tumulicola]MBB2181200.1 hypothetical protein [Gluconacetobacter tumulicola]